MKIASQGDTVTVSDVSELCEVNSDAFHASVCRALPPNLRAIEVDLTHTRFIDSRGLGALVGIQKAAARLHGPVSLRLINPSPAIQQLFELTRLHQLFEIVQR